MDEKNKSDAEANEGRSNLNTIGCLLRSARENLNQGLDEVSRKLRIRQVYLEAIENDQFNTLPGEIYVIGFIKSYSVHLGLDSKTIIEQYKSEIQDVHTKPDLKFPAYVPENSIPGGALLLLGLMISIAGYSGWYYFSVKNTFSTNRVASIPEPLTSLIDDEPEVPVISRKNKIAPEIVYNEEGVIKENGIETPKNIKKFDVDAVNKDLIDKKIEKNSAAYAQNLAQKILAPKVDAIEPTGTQIPIQKKPAAPETTELPEAGAKPFPAITTEPSLKLNIESATKEKIEPNLSVDNKQKKLANINDKGPSKKDSIEARSQIQLPPAPPSRIVLVAIADSYIQIRDNIINQLLVTRLLRQGQRYEVPDRSGLTLITGNAGALKILVDGIAVPKIGPVGAIRRNVVLDPNKLTVGLAVIK